MKRLFLAAAISAAALAVSAAELRVLTGLMQFWSL